MIFKIILAVILLAILFSFLYHRISLWSEKKKFLPPGRLVKVNQHAMHVYAEGQGAPTLVFLSGGGTPCPSLDFKALYSRFSKDERIVVVERAGYGFSEPARVARDVDTVLEETRSALKLGGENGPYVLFPHSISGLEAIHWVQKYPHEVKAIIGLDPSVPAVYQKVGEQKIKMFVLVNSFSALFFQLGFSRFFTSFLKKDPVLQGNALTDAEKAAYRAIVQRRSQTSNNRDEIRSCYANANLVAALGAPVDTPMYFFISDGKEIGFDGWQELLAAYVKQVKTGRYELLDCGHYVHDHEPEHIALESKKFLAEQC